MPRTRTADLVFLGSAAAGLLLAYGVSPGSLVASVVSLACPVLVLLMVRGMMGGRRPDPGRPQHDADGPSGGSIW
jgi:hypothetical protein